MTEAKKRPWLTPALILAVILIPLIFAVLVFVRPAWFALGHTNHGQLVRPPIKIQVAGLARPASTAMLPASYFKGRWTLVYIGAAKCRADCKAELYAMRQARIATGEHMRQVQRLYVAPGGAPPEAGLAANWPGLTFAVATGAAGTRFVQQFNAVRPAGGVYIVDPNGLLMMTFSKHANPEGLVKDLRHLLNVNS
ncbi:MAG: SCO family protein [Gammaproteobacteria bacterium]